MRLSKVDPSSFSEPENIITKHINLQWDINFASKTVKGCAIYEFECIHKDIKFIILDIRDIKISNASVLVSGQKIPVNHFVSEDVPDIGSKLNIELPTGSTGKLIVELEYETSSNASALQWLTPEQTLGKKHPYLFSQCQSIHARSLLPCQDTPAVKFTYNAIVRHPVDLKALMSAIRTDYKPGCTKFEQTIPIPSYLLAIAVGDLVSRSLGPNCNVWSESDIIDECAEEFSETSLMLKAASEICGPYVWKQYDLLVMPPSFPFGGMENPCLTFVTPTVLAGDKSLANVIAHEIAHSWTGNLITNKNFEHFWLNEGFTVFVECKIMGRLKGTDEQDFHAVSNLVDLEDTIQNQLEKTPELTKLIVDLTNCSPDDAFSTVPYVKGSTFLRYLEDLFGCEKIFEEFLRSYFEEFKYKSIITDDFKSKLFSYFANTEYSTKLDVIDWDEWLYGEGMPPIIPKFSMTLIESCNRVAELWATKTVKELKLINENDLMLSNTNQIIDMLSKLIAKNEIIDLNNEKLSQLENIYRLNDTKNSEIRFRFMRLCIRAKSIAHLNQIFEFLNSNFRMKFERPLYRDLSKWLEVRQRTIDNFNLVRNQMMTVCSNMVARDLEIDE